ncbi:c-type cytochrome [Campylobacter geochelonis]|uniref:Ubiquinol--cytochrome c reductase, cytochrome c1 subunit n=1 Tax=Campylobacter geochelonis TaxID=1780362 RepID=A0A128EN35_9BACT|nr:c-type cytochrome [Campylobacter geochelonis]QKF70787.1 ubiquinol cytochrome c oxidoreductase PetABC, membrane-bound cytochrome c subunit [Campylobacter geochelonis]CZE47340.1 ubiquinol--cytochrome c reductase%2C cytochrome c1 subunit [Campylobacter geochelonis]CZE48660.1 ubiquinol--cytochrome c reductase%2C cytochrome c1 subunit [Campylobacter geochelonis]CZE50556.1 ubiquinol--cytochrome c reductase%2C cytochrome c1 subunit [Campylobacter geochelonis]
MKELKTLIIVLVAVGALYWGVEPYAHTKLHPHVAPANYDFAAEDLALDKTNVTKAEAALKVAEASKNDDLINSAKKTLNDAKATNDKYTIFWSEINKIDLSKGNATTGAETFMSAGCTACHGLEVANIPAAMDSKTSSEAYGVNPPDLSTAGAIYDGKFLAALIKDPVMAMKVSHKFNDEHPHPMPGFFGLGGDLNQEIADIVAYLKSIAPKEVDGKQVFKDACQRCHDMKYDKVFTDGNKQSVAHFMGSTPPDLSMYIRSRNADYLHNFINDTQKMLPGTAMPRVGLNQASEAKIIAYMEKVGDSKKSEREKTSVYIMIYFVILAVFAGLWKNKIWSSLH